jgi:hypothetical protein
LQIKYLSIPTENYTPQNGESVLGSIRVITILHLDVKTDRVYCVFKYSDGSLRRVKALHVTFVNDYMWTSYVATFVVCPVTQTQGNELPVHVGITYNLEPSMRRITSTVTVKYPSYMNNPGTKPSPSGMVVCAGPAFDYTNSLRIVEYVELWKKLGATKFYFYNKTVSAAVDRVVRFYRDHGDMRVFNWTLEGIVYYCQLSIKS